MDCAEVYQYRGRLERARDARIGRLDDPATVQAFDDRFREFVDARTKHREQTGCTDFH
jgi:hypothetical protein